MQLAVRIDGATERGIGAGALDGAMRNHRGNQRYVALGINAATGRSKGTRVVTVRDRQIGNCERIGTEVAEYSRVIAAINRQIFGAWTLQNQQVLVNDDGRAQCDRAARHL